MEVVEQLQATLLRQRVMMDESHLNLSIHLWDQAMSLPVVLGPVGMAGMYSSRGEVKAANPTTPSRIIADAQRVGNRGPSLRSE